MKYVYHYDPETRVYIGREPADPSPLERDVYLLPAHATFKEPFIQSGLVPVYDTEGEMWTYLEDNRGVYLIINNGRHEQVVVENLGEPKPQGAVTEEYYYAVLEEKNWRDSELERTDKFMLSDYPISFLTRRKVKKYRKQLRNWPESEHFPNSEHRPQIL